MLHAGDNNLTDLPAAVEAVSRLIRLNTLVLRVCESKDLEFTFYRKVSAVKSARNSREWWFSIFVLITKDSRLLLNTIHSQMILSIILGMDQNLKSPIVTCRVILLTETKHTGMTYSMLHKYLTWIMRL